MEKKTKLRIEREKQGVSVLELSRRSDVSFEKCRQLDRGYRVETTSYEIKEKVAAALGKNPWEVFPDIVKQHKRYLDYLDESESRLRILKTFAVDYSTSKKEEMFFKRVLMKLDPQGGELEAFYQSGTDMEYVRGLIYKYARKYGVKKGR